MTEHHKQTTQDQIFDPGITHSIASSSSYQNNIEIDNKLITIIFLIIIQLIIILKISLLLINNFPF